MSDQEIIDQLREQDPNWAYNQCCGSCTGGAGNWQDVDARKALAALRSEGYEVVERDRFVPKTWDGMMELLDTVYPTSIFPFSAEDNPQRDPGPRIVSLIRRINEIRQGVRRG